MMGAAEPSANTIQQKTTSTPVSIPMHGEQGAPTVDINKPRTLIQFLKELEVLLIRAGVTAEANKKEVVQCLDMEIEDIWSSYPEFKNQAKIYSYFKDAIIDHYPEASGEFLYLLHDIDALIGERY